jgi:hypothetical protein
MSDLDTPGHVTVEQAKYSTVDSRKVEHFDFNSILLPAYGYSSSHLILQSLFKSSWVVIQKAP